MRSGEQFGGVLPVVGELSEQVWLAIAEGQPVLLTRDGRPAAVLLDVDSYAEVEASLNDGIDEVAAA